VWRQKHTQRAKCPSSCESSEAVLAVTPVILQFVHPIGPMVSRSGGRTRHYRNRISLCITTPRPACEFGEATKAIKEIIIRLEVGEVGERTREARAPTPNWNFGLRSECHEVLKDIRCVLLRANDLPVPLLRRERRPFPSTPTESDLATTSVTARDHATPAVSSRAEKMRQVPANGTRSQSGRCASSYSIS